MLAFLQEVTLSIATAETASATLSQVLQKIARFMDWPLAHVYVWSEEKEALISSGIWFVRDQAAGQQFRQLTAQTQFTRGVGALGKILLSKKALAILDVTQDPDLVRQLPGANIHAYFAFPVAEDDRVTAVLEFFSQQTVMPDEAMMSIVTHVSVQLGLALRRHRTEQALYQREAQLAEAQRIAHVGHWEWDVQLDKVTWSAELYRIFGLKPGEFKATYEQFLDRIHPGDLPLVRQKVEAAYQNGRSFNYFHRIVRPDGIERVLHARGEPVLDTQGNIIKLIGTVQDLTEQKETELKLSQTVRQLSALNKIGQAITSTLDSAAIYEQVLSLLRPLLGAETIIIFLHDKDDLVIVASDHASMANMRQRRISRDDSIAGEVRQSGQSLLLRGEDLQQRLAPQLRQAANYQPQAMLAVPINWQERQVGVIEATHSRTDAFDEDDLHLLETAAAWTAIAMANTRQHEQLQRRLRESEAVAVISAALAETQKLDRVLELIVEATLKIVPSANWAAIHLLQGKPERLFLLASAGLKLGTGDYDLDLGQGIAGSVLAEGQVINVPDLQEDPRRLTIDQNLNIRALLVAPVKSRTQCIGTVSVQSAVPNAFTVDDEQLLTVLGAQAGMAIENARLFTSQQQARRMAERRREQMQRLARRVVMAQEDERRRISRELHDEAGQALTSLKIGLDLIRKDISPKEKPVQETLVELIDLTDKTMNSLRLLAHNLRPPGLDAYGLAASLAGLCQDFMAHTQLQVEYNGTELPQLPQLTELSLYRFAQEALTNVLKHAEASRANVTLYADAEKIMLSIFDNGRGFDRPPTQEAADFREGFGISGMIERLEMIGGRLDIQSAPGQGTRLAACVPLLEETNQP